MNNVIEIKEIFKKYDDKLAVDKVNLDIPKGQIIGLIGANGAGKTTLIKLILDIVHADSGTIKKNINNEDIGVVLDNMFLPEILYVNDIKKIMKDIYVTWSDELFSKYLSDFNIPGNKQIKKLSKGMKKKVELATALAHNPKLLILDEATSGLDPVVRNEVIDIFLDFVSDPEKTIIFSTHITSDLENVCDRIVFIDNGKIILNESRDDVMDNFGIVKCSESDFENMNKDYVIRCKKNKYDYHVLVSKRSLYQDYIVDKISLDELMVQMIKGDRVC